MTKQISTKGPTKKRNRKYNSTKKKNPVAKDLRNPKYKQRVVRPDKIYKREKSKKINLEEEL